jgi:hypothetical protein
MSIVSKLLGLGVKGAKQAVDIGGSVLSQGISKVLPTSEERILNNLMSAAPKILARKEGFSFDPRRGKFLDQQVGSMMGTLPNDPSLAPVQAGGGVARNVQELLQVARQPEVMSRLQRGQFLGGWDEGQGMGLDPSRRFMSTYGAIREGMGTQQAAGFKLGSGSTFDVTPESLTAARNKLVAGTAATGLTLGVPGTLAVPQARDFLSGLGREEAPVVEDRPATIKATFQPVIEKPIINMLIKAGVKESSEGGFEKATIMLKNRAKSILNKIDDLADIPDDLPETESAPLIYQRAYDALKKEWGKLTKPEVEVKLTKLKASPKVTVQDDGVGEQPLIDYVLSRKGKSTKQGTSSSTVSQSLADVGSKPITHAANQKEAARLIRQGEVDKVVQTFYEIKNNFIPYLPQADIAEAQARGNNPVFYTLSSLLTRAQAAMMGSSQMRLGMLKGLASAAKPPIVETRMATSLAAMDAPSMQKLKTSPFPTILEDAAKNIGAKSKPKSKKAAKELGIEDAWNEQEAAEQLLKAERDAGSLINTKVSAPSEIGKISNSMDLIQDDIINFVKNPTSIPGIKEKIYTYLGTIINPKQNLASTIDSWMMRAAFGDVNLSTANNADEYALVHFAINDLARQLKLRPSVVQEIIWKNIRFANRETNAAFLPFDDVQYQYPYLNTKALKNIPKNVPKLSSLKKELQPINDAFADKLVKALQQDPELAKYFEIVGEDVQFTDEFFRLLDLVE